MRTKILLCVVVAGSVLGGLVFGQSLQLSHANVTCVTTDQFEVMCDGIAWVIRRTSNTTPANPAPGTTVTVVCKSPDAQRKENPTWTPAPCATPTPTPKPAGTSG
jgi:hypothetical protein